MGIEQAGSMSGKIRGLISREPEWPNRDIARVLGTTSARVAQVRTVMKKRAVVHAAATSANDTQVAGTHYKGKAIQPWDYIVSNELGYLEGNIVKYVSRYKEKGTPKADLLKARHYLDKLLESFT